MEDGSKIFRTDDTSLATYLSLHIEPKEYKWEERVCFWYFPDSPELAALVRDFSGGEARVDPREYSTMFSKRKKEMYQAQQEYRRRGTGKVTRAAEEPEPV